MKHKLLTWLLNPFRYLAGWQALAVGVLLMLLTAVMASFSCIRFDGVLDIHLGAALSVVSHVQLLSVDYLLATVLLCISGMLFSKSRYRMIDIAGTQLVARWPFVWIALLGLLVQLDPVRDAAKQLSPEQVHSLFTVPFILLLCVSVVVTIWMIVLMYRSYTTSFNLSGARAIISFIVCLLAAEICSKIIIITFIK